MKISEIASAVNGTILCAEDRADVEMQSAFASDMMSDVLAYVHEQSVLITGLANPQIVRTAEMMDMSCIILVRGKQPDYITLKLAEEKNIVLISTQESMYKTSGILYGAGLKA